MRIEQVWRELREGKKVIRPGWGWPRDINDLMEMTFSSAALFDDNWFIFKEPTPPKLLAPAIYYTGTEWILGRVLFESKKEAQEEYVRRQVIWPAIPNKDGMHEVSSENLP